MHTKPRAKAGQQAGATRETNLQQIMKPTQPRVYRYTWSNTCQYWKRQSYYIHFPHAIFISYCKLGGLPASNGQSVLLKCQVVHERLFKQLRVHIGQYMCMFACWCVRSCPHSQIRVRMPGWFPASVHPFAEVSVNVCIVLACSHPCLCFCFAACVRCVLKRARPYACDNFC